MVVDIRIRKSVNMQYDDMKLSNMIAFGDWNILFCIYRGEQYFASIDYQELRFLSSNEELVNYINSKPIYKWIEGINLDRISRLFFEYKNAVVILLEKPNYNMDEILAVNKVDIGFGSEYVDFATFMKLKSKGIRSYAVNIPSEVKTVYGPFSKMMLTEQCLRETNIRKEYEDDIKRITNCSVDEYFEKIIKRLANGKEYGSVVKLSEEERKRNTIFLVGPCIVMGCSPSEQELAEMISDLLANSDYFCNIVKINSRYFPNELLEYDIGENDIVIFLGTNLKYSDYDFTDIYEMYDGTKNLCSNTTMHVSEEGCKLIADAIVNDIILENKRPANDVGGGSVLHFAETKQLSAESEYEIKMYLQRTNIPRHIRRGKNGAIVMNANPFTIGHMKLVEYAASIVDRLFVFVVEEDVSFFSYKERLEMVLQGTKNIKNVIVLGSGDFVISNKTFYDYFTKEINNEKIIDASKDILIFARYIVPYFNIIKRFVGNEPTDKITDQYNKQMKMILPEYGCELIEISRIMKDSNIVSGSMVRKAVFEKNVEYLRNMFPASSFWYVFQNLDILQKRTISTKQMRKVSICMTDRLQSVCRLIEFIKREKYVVIYGVGKDTQILLKLLNEKEISKLIFVDKKAKESEVIFLRKTVYDPCRLKKLPMKYNIVILSSKYYKEIYYECIKYGIDRRRIRYNPYNLYSFPLELYSMPYMGI